MKSTYVVVSVDEISEMEGELVAQLDDAVESGGLQFDWERLTVTHIQQIAHALFLLTCQC